MLLANTIIIAVMGVTGAGKTSFINLVSGGNFSVSNGLNSCTSSVEYSHPFDLDGRNVVLMDTPGFDDSTLKDVDVLNMIAVDLARTYEMDLKLSGIIYFHRIADNKMSGSARRNLRMFRELCGEETLRNVVVATTMWDLVDPKVGDVREMELCMNEDLFKPVLDKGARMVRYNNTIESARGILRSIINNHPMPLQIQTELVDEGKGISETRAGEELDRELAAMARQHEEELKRVEKEKADALAAKDRLMGEKLQDLKERQQELETKLEEAKRDRERMSKDYHDMKKKLEEQPPHVIVYPEPDGFWDAAWKFLTAAAFGVRMANMEPRVDAGAFGAFH